MPPNNAAGQVSMDTKKMGGSMSEAKPREQAQILVRFDKALTPVEIGTINKKLGATVINVMSDGFLFLVEIAYPDSRPQIIKAYTATKGVVYAESNAEIRIPETPDQLGVNKGTSPLIMLPKISN